MAILLALCAALAYGVTDFTAGIASRRIDAGTVTAALQGLGLLTVCVGVVLLPGIGPRAAALGYGALSGIGSTVGSLALYQGMTTGRMAVVATLSATLTAVLPAIFGVVLGQSLSLLAALGVIISIPAIGLVSWQPGGSHAYGAGAGAGYGLLSGAGFALLFIALDRAGTRSGAWPLLPGQAVALVAALPFARPGALLGRGTSRRTAAMIVVTGVISAGANLLFLAASGRGDLAVVAVLSAMYPAVTVVLARVWLGETTTATQTFGLLASAGAVLLVTLG